MPQASLNHSKLIADDQQLSFLNSLPSTFSLDTPDSRLSLAKTSLQASCLGLHEVALRIARLGMLYAQEQEIQGEVLLFQGILATVVEGVNEWHGDQIDG